jgi:short-subunit dehydrogenase
MDTKNKTIVVIGATGGIGRELVRKLDSEGANLILVSKTETELLTLIKSLKGKNHKYYVCDLTDQSATLEIAKTIFRNRGDLSILINAAGIGIYDPIHNLSLKKWNTSFDVNVTSAFIMTREFLEQQNSEEQLVLNIGSGAGVIPMSGRSLYCATKFALRGFTLSLAEEFSRIGKPKFCLITLGSTLTSFGPMSFETKKEEMEKGKAYFTPSWVADKLTEIIKDDNREVEYTLYPGDYGFGEWKKPEPLI